MLEICIREKHLIKVIISMQENFTRVLNFSSTNRRTIELPHPPPKKKAMRPPPHQIDLHAPKST